MTVLIIEGPDLSGKSYAIEKIGKAYKTGFILKNLYKPTKARDGNIYACYWNIINKVLDQPFVILDRFYPSQAVYSYLRGEDEMESGEIFAIEKFLLDQKLNKFIIVYLNTDLKTLKKRYIQRGDEHIDISDLRKISERYEIFYNLTKLPVICVDTMEDGWLIELKKAVSRLENEYR